MQFPFVLNNLVRADRQRAQQNSGNQRVDCACHCRRDWHACGIPTMVHRASRLGRGTRGEPTGSQPMQKLHKDQPRLSVLGKVLGVLEAVTEHPQGVGLPDLAAKLGLSRQTVHRVLCQLENTGLLMRDPVRERFSMGPRLARLSLTALASNNGWAPIRATMQEVVDEVGETCNIGVLDGLDYVYVERIECQWPLRLHIDVGTRAPAHCLAGGKVLLAHLEPRACARLIRSRKLVARTPRSITNAADLEAEFEHSSCPGLRPEQRGEFRGYRGCGGARQERAGSGACGADHARSSATPQRRELRGARPAPASGGAARRAGVGAHLITC